VRSLLAGACNVSRKPACLRGQRQPADLSRDERHRRAARDRRGARRSSSSTC
jgi:hypothetical protein